LDAWLAALPYEGIGVVGLCFATVAAFWRGWLFAGPVVRELTKVRDERIAELITERDALRQTIAVKDETLREALGQNTELLTLARTGNALMEALVKATGRDSA